MTRALISGITGFVGSHLCDFLIANTDWQIYGLKRWRSPLANIAAHLASDRLRLIDGDLRDDNSLRRVINLSRPDFVFHLAAQSYPTTSFTAPRDTYETNIIGTSNLLEAIRQYAPEAQVHVCASSEVFGRVTQAELPIKEECRFHPASPYAISKVGTDLIGRFYHEAYGLNVQTTRMFTHTGPRRGDVFVESNFAKQIAFIEAGKIDPVVHVGNLASMRTWCDVRDAVRAYHLLLTHDPQPGASYNIGGNFSCKVSSMLNTLLDMSTVSRIGIWQDDNRVRPIDADLQVPDTSKFGNHTGWKPEIAFEQTMKDLLDYWRLQVASGAAVLRR